MTEEKQPPAESTTVFYETIEMPFIWDEPAPVAPEKVVEYVAIVSTSKPARPAKKSASQVRQKAKIPRKIRVTQKARRPKARPKKASQKRRPSVGTAKSVKKRSKASKVRSSPRSPKPASRAKSKKVVSRRAKSPARKIRTKPSKKIGSKTKGKRR